ncbi:MAG TPA: nucleotide pyrophosphohydrolase [Longimicrobiaceae bacterium]
MEVGDWPSRHWGLIRSARGEKLGALLSGSRALRMDEVASGPADRLYPNQRPLDMDLRAAQREVDAYISQFKEGYFPPLVNLARLAEEVGELARELNHLHGKKTRKADEPDGDVALELADILFVIIVLSNQLGVDLQEAMERTLEKYRVRDADRWERKDPED